MESLPRTKQLKGGYIAYLENHDLPTQTELATARPKTLSEADAEREKRAMEMLARYELSVFRGLSANGGLSKFMQEYPNYGEITIQDIALSLIFASYKRLENDKLDLETDDFIEIREALPESVPPLHPKYQDIATTFLSFCNV